MKNFKLFFYVLIGLLGILSATPLNAQDHNFTGKVITCATGIPLYANVTAIDTKNKSVKTKDCKTDAQGNFKLKLDPSKYTISVKSNGYQNLDEIEIDLEKCSPIEETFCLASASITTYFEGTTSLLPTNILESPATGVYVFDKLKIKRRGYETLLDLLEDVPEVHIHKNSIEETRDYYGIRGITGNEKILIFLDNVRMTASTGDLHAIGYNYSLVDAERVEVIMGPASAIYGVDAFAGVIRIVTTQFINRDQGNCKPKSEDPLSYQFKAGTDHRLNALRFRGHVVSRWKRGGISMAVDLHKFGGFNLPNHYPEEFKFYTDTVQPFGIVKTPGGTLTSLPASTSKSFSMPTRTGYTHIKAQFDAFEIGYAYIGEQHSSSAGIRPDFTMYNDSAVVGTTVQNLYGSHQYYNEKKNVSLRSTLSFNTFEGSKNGGFVNTYTGFTKAYKYQYAASRKIEEILQYNVNGDGFFHKSFLIAGASFENILSIPKTGDLPKAFDRDKPYIEQDLYFIGTDTSDFQGNSLKLLQDIYTLRYQNYGAFAQFSKGLESAPSLGYTLGIRYDYNTRYSATWNPRLSLVCKPVDNWILKGQFGTSFLAPSPSKAYAQWGGFTTKTNTQGDIVGLQSFFMHQPNPDLEPERLRSLEFGASYNVRDEDRFKTILSVNTFFISTSNTIEILGEYKSQTTFKGWDVGLREIPVNKGEGKVKTLGATLKFDGEYIFSESSPHILFPYVFLSYIKGSVNDVDGLPYTPKFSALAGIDWQFNKLTISPRATYKGKMYGIGTSFEGQPYQSDSYLVVNLNARFDFDNHAGLTLRVNNLLNNKYYNIVYGGNTGLIGTPQDPIFFMVGFVYQH